MTIKEIENLSGMTRANIRFYETEGLLRPARNSNGYRNYSEEDLNTLQKIRLLRTLHLSLEDIRSVSLGQSTLTEVLSAHIPHLKKSAEDLEHYRSICSQICADGTDYRTLDAEHYLSLMDSPSDAPELKEDTLMKVTSPWKRFFRKKHRLRDPQSDHRLLPCHGAAYQRKIIQRRNPDLRLDRANAPSASPGTCTAHPDGHNAGQTALRAARDRA